MLPNTTTLDRYFSMAHRGGHDPPHRVETRKNTVLASVNTGNQSRIWLVETTGNDSRNGNMDFATLSDCSRVFSDKRTLITDRTLFIEEFIDRLDTL